MVQSINEIKSGEVYSYVNEFNYVSIQKVEKVTEKSVFVFSLLSDGKFSTRSHRFSFNSFKKYTLQPNYPL